MVDEGWLQEALGGVWVNVKEHLFSAAFSAQPAATSMGGTGVSRVFGRLTWCTHYDTPYMRLQTVSKGKVTSPKLMNPKLYPSVRHTSSCYACWKAVTPINTLLVCFACTMFTL